MTVQEAISARPQRAYLFDKAGRAAIVNALRAEIRACNAEGGLHIQLVMNEPMAFRGFFCALREIPRRVQLHRACRKTRKGS